MDNSAPKNKMKKCINIGIKLVVYISVVHSGPYYSIIIVKKENWVNFQCLTGFIQWFLNWIASSLAVGSFEELYKVKDFMAGERKNKEVK